MEPKWAYVKEARVQGGWLEGLGVNIRYITGYLCCYSVVLAGECQFDTLTLFRFSQ
jgi:hypothetical protein